MKKVISAFFAFALILCACTHHESAPQEYKQPASNPNEITFSYGSDPSSEMSVSFSSGSKNPSVEYTTMEQYLKNGFESAEHADAEPYKNRYESRIYGLSANTEYVLRIDGGDAFRFQTADSGDFSFLYMSDTQSDSNDEYGYGVFGKIYSAALSENAAFALYGGDMVNEETDASEWSTLFSSADFSRIPSMPVTGNHTNGSTYMSYFALPLNGPENYKELFYSFDYGNAHFVMLDSSYMGNTEDIVVDEISEWLRDDLYSTNKKWKIAVMHHPMYTITASSKDEARAEAMRKNYLPIMEQGGIDIILCGHQHVVCRTKSMSGIIQWMCVSGGKSYSPLDHDYTAYVTDIAPVYTIAKVEQNRITLTAKSSDGTIADSITIEKE